jgi:hypothetical protein
MIRDTTDPVVIKYSAISIVFSIALVFTMTHIILDLGLESLLEFLNFDKLGKLRMGLDSGDVSFILTFFLFSFVMPWITAFIFPVTLVLQLLLAKRFSLSFQKQTLGIENPKAVGYFRCIWIVFKWSLLEGIISIFLFPFYHIPVIGSIISVFVIAAWGTVIYFEIVARAYVGGFEFWKVLIDHIGNLFLISISAVFSNYLMIWILGFIGIVLPPLSHASFAIMIASVTIGNYILLAEFIRTFQGYRREQLLITSSR